MAIPKHNQLVDEIEEYIHLNILPSSKIVSKKRANDIIDTLGATSKDSLRKLMYTYFLISKEVRSFIDIFPTTIEKTTIRTIQEDIRVRGQIHWGQTIKLQNMNPGIPKYAWQTPAKLYDTTYNQVLKYLIIKLLRMSEEYLKVIPKDNLSDTESLIGEIRYVHKKAANILKSSSFVDISIINYIPLDYIRSLKEMKLPIYKLAVNLYNLYYQIFISKNISQLISSMLIKQIIPKEDDKLFELGLLFIILKELDRITNCYNGNRTFDVIGKGANKVAVYKINDVRITIRFQTQHKALLASSKYKEYLRELGMENYRSRMPDIIISVKSKEKPTEHILVEAKYTENMKYIFDSIYKMFGYIYDFSGVLKGRIKGILVVGDGIPNIVNEYGKYDIWTINYKNINETIERLIVSYL